ncbi:hypothetical protein CAC42_4892 [Sphaceloma murrayae]|uniref:Uncharacterized protein n=1 Tax=Sphaceloma murrayae TaxID=2082308 RepID=A0A2K1QP89_9PEZI|nr:hypothetical protein CAC42_4892 [Sphaceloma murrayae]
MVTSSSDLDQSSDIREETNARGRPLNKRHRRRTSPLQHRKPANQELVDTIIQNGERLLSTRAEAHRDETVRQRKVAAQKLAVAEAKRRLVQQNKAAREKRQEIVDVVLDGRGRRLLYFLKGKPGGWTPEPRSRAEAESWDEWLKRYKERPGKGKERAGLEWVRAGWWGSEDYGPDGRGRGEGTGDGDGDRGPGEQGKEGKHRVEGDGRMGQWNRFEYKVLGRRVEWTECLWGAVQWSLPIVVYRIWVPHQETRKDSGAGCVEEGDEVVMKGEVMEEDGRELLAEWDTEISEFGRYADGCSLWEKMMRATRQESEMLRTGVRDAVAESGP